MQKMLNNPLFSYLIISLLAVTSFIFLFAIEYQGDSFGWLEMLTFSTPKMRSQGIWFLISLVVGFGVYYFTTQSLLFSLAYPLYVLNILLLILTIFLSSDVRGSHSWLSFGGFNFQPAELSKVIVAICLAKFCSTQKFINNTKSQMIIIAIILLPAMFIIAQKEVGQVLIYLSLFIPLYMQGISVRYLYIAMANVFAMYLIFVLDMFYVDTLFIATCFFITFYHIAYKVKIKNKVLYYVRIAVVMTAIFMIYHVTIPFAVNHFMQPHHIRRIVSIIDADKKERDWMDKNTRLTIQHTNFKAIKYNVRQAEIAIGSGGLLGKGIRQSTQMRLSFIPEQHTDFIFSAVAEGWGLIGCTYVLALYFLLLLHLLVLARKQSNMFNAFLMYSFLGYVFFYMMINVGMVIGVFPVVGVPLPWLSYGGSSFLTNTAMIAIVIKLSHKKYVDK